MHRFEDVPPFLMHADTDPSLIPDPDVLPTDREDEVDIEEVVKEMQEEEDDEEDEDLSEEEDEDEDEEIDPSTTLETLAEEDDKNHVW
jgi:hypothetical protein